MWGFLEVVLGQIPEAIYFSLFMIFAKELKEKRVLFTLIMIFEYLILLSVIKYNVLFQFIYTFMTYVILKVLYKDKAIITDIFVFMIASLILIAVSFVSYMVVLATIKNYYVAVILNRIILAVILVIFKDKLSYFYKNYKLFWNRRKGVPVKIRSLTLRNISIILFNLMFYIINIGLIYFVTNFKVR